MMDTRKLLTHSPWLIALTLTLSACTTDEARDKVLPGLNQEVGAKVVKPADDKLATSEAITPKVPEGLPALTGAHFAAFDLLANRPLAHRMEVAGAGAVVALSAADRDFIRYINGNYPEDWALDLKLEDSTGAGLKGRKGTIWFPSYRTQGAQTLQLFVHNPAAGDNFLSATLNGTALEKTKLEQGWQILSLKVPAGTVLHENTLDLDFSNMGRYDKKLSGGAIGWLRLGPEAAVAARALKKDAGAAPAPEGDEPAGDVAKSDGAKSDLTKREDLNLPHSLPMAQDALTLAPSQGLAYHIWALPESKLAMTIVAKPGCGPVIKAWRNEGGGKVGEVLNEKRALVEGRGESQETVVDLSGVAGERGALVRLELMADVTCTEALTLQRAELVVPGNMPARAQAPAPKYILFWMIDTLRADHLPFYNPKTNVETPNLTKLVEEGGRFNLAYVQGNESKVSHASLFSGMYPSRHRVLARGSLKPHHEILPEAIKKSGYKTGAHISNGYISEPWGFKQGWDHFINNLRDGWSIDGASMAKHAITWATANKDKPFFLYVGTIDPHVTYRRHDDIIGKYDELPYSGRYDRYCSGEDLGKIKGGSLKVNDRDKLRIKNLYKNEITFNDEAFGTVRAAFEELGIWDETMVVVTADHGDEFWEHGGVGHGHSVHQELVHVPLLMYYKPMIKPGTVVDAGVDVLDVYPTIMDMLGKPRPENLQGKSVLPLLLGQHAGYPEPAIATRYLGHYGVQLQQYKLYLRKGEYQLYDRSSDPDELVNASAAHPLASRWLLDSASWFRSNRKAWDKTTWGVPSKLSPDFLSLLEQPDEK